MWPFASANNDSVLASASRSRCVSRTDQGSTANAVGRHPRPNSSPRSATTRSAPRSAQRVGVADPIDADDEPEAARASGGDAGERVLEDRRLRRLDVELARGREKGVRSRLPAELVSRRRAGRRSAPRTGRRDPPPRARRGSWRCRRRPLGAARRRTPPAGRSPSPDTARRHGGGSARAARSFFESPNPTTVASSASMPARREERRARRRTAVARRRTARNRRPRTGRSGSCVRRLRSRRKPSKVSFQAAVCRSSVWVSTPSRSNRQARMPGGRPRRALAPDRDLARSCSAGMPPPRGSSVSSRA